MQLRAGLLAGLVACGLPTGMSASLSPNPALARSGGAGGGADGATVTLVVSVDHTVPALSYPLAIYATVQDQSGAPSNFGAGIFPRGVSVTVDSFGQVTLTPLPTIPPVGFNGCSAPPPGFGPVATPTIAAGAVQVSSSVSDPNPRLNETETVFARALVNGQPVPNVPVTVTWYLPNGTFGCGSLSTDSNGSVSCSRVIDQILPGFSATIQVVFTIQGQTYTSYTGFVE